PSIQLVQHQVDDGGHDATGEEADIAELWVVGGDPAQRNRRRLVPEWHGRDDPSQHGDESLPVWMTHVVEHGLAILTAMPTIYGDDNREVGRDPVGDQQQEAFV